MGHGRGFFELVVIAEVDGELFEPMVKPLASLLMKVKSVMEPLAEMLVKVTSMLTKSVVELLAEMLAKV